MMCILMTLSMAAAALAMALAVAVLSPATAGLHCCIALPFLLPHLHNRHTHLPLPSSRCCFRAAYSFAHAQSLCPAACHRHSAIDTATALNSCCQPPCFLLPPPLLPSSIHLSLSPSPPSIASSSCPFLSTNNLHTPPCCRRTCCFYRCRMTHCCSCFRLHCRLPVTTLAFIASPPHPLPLLLLPGPLLAPQPFTGSVSSLCCL